MRPSLRMPHAAASATIASTGGASAGRIGRRVARRRPGARARRSTVRPDRGRPPCTTCSRSSRPPGSTACPASSASTTRVARSSRTCPVAPSPSTTEQAPDEMLADAAARGCAGSTTSSAAYDPGPRTWRQSAASLAPGQLICHNDTGAYNWIVDGDRFAGDDRLGSGRARVIRSTTSRSSAGAASRSSARLPATDAARRVRIAAEAYGGVDPAAARSTRSRIACTRASDRIAAGIERGDPGMLSLADARASPSARAAASTRFAARRPARTIRARTL